MFSAVYEGKGMKFCTQVARTCVHKRSVLDFHLFALIGTYRREFQTVHKIQPINIRYLPNLQFFKKWLISNMLKHTRNTNNSGIFISRFTMNTITPKLQTCWTQKIAFKIISKMPKQPNFFHSQPYDTFLPDRQIFMHV